LSCRAACGADELDNTNWIWISPQAKKDEVAYFRKSFEIKKKIRIAAVAGTADDRVEIFLNGKLLFVNDNWKNPQKALATNVLRVGTNVIAAKATNGSGDAAMIVKCDILLEDQTVQSVFSESTWKASHTMTDGWNDVGYDDSSWTYALALAPYGSFPWGKLPPSVLPQATPANTLRTLPGFKVELLYTVPRGPQGSWVNLTVDPRGRLITSDQYGSLYRVTVPAVGGRASDLRVEEIELDVGSAQGLLYAFDSLYVMVNADPKKSGLYRVRDTDGDDVFDTVELLRAIPAGGEHGPHAVLLSPDGKSLFVLGGNHTRLPEISGSRFPGKVEEDLLLPRQWDGQGHAKGILAPGGWICKVDPDGKKWELVSVGYRNQFDAAFNSDGELFTFDADMEWDYGTPWYRPTRVCHAVSASEFGWRSGTGKWPAYFPDSLPATVDIGPGCPTGVTFGSGAKFPARYQRAFFICDWTFGTMYAVHMQPDGASYRAEFEEFVSGRPLPLSDVVIGKDGAMYFLIGGRHAQSGLYRVTYVGPDSTEDAVSKRSASLLAAKGMRRLRRRLESYHGVQDAKAVDFAWPFLGRKDRFVRYAARVAVEHQPVETWQERALSEPSSVARTEALIALARQGDASLQPRVLAALGEIEITSLTRAQFKAILRAYALTFIRMGDPDTPTKRSIAAHLDPHYPSKDTEVNRELSHVLVYLQAPAVIDKTLALLGTVPAQVPTHMGPLLARNPGYGAGIIEMYENMPPVEDIHHVFALRTLRYGWTLEQRAAYFRWFDAALSKNGGHSYEKFLEHIETEALANVSKAERAELAEVLGEDPGAPRPPPEIPAPHGPGKEWEMGELLALVQNGLKGRNFEKGERAYAAARCGSCHRFAARGGIVGPDLTNSAGRFGYRDILESIFEPSKVISDQYASTVLVTSDGGAHVGRIVSEDDENYFISTDPLSPYELTTVAKSTVLSKELSKTSLMPDKLLNALNQDEVLDLLAYVLSQGNPRDTSFD
jgi:putative heme-binding domain-containing protein